METSLHRQLKVLYAGPRAACEVQVAGYRIDAVYRGRLIEIQQASLSALRRKVSALVNTHSVLVVKPLITRKVIVRHDPHTLEVLSQRASPRHESVWNLFLDLVHFVDVFPHPRLSLEVVLTEVEEHRVEQPARRWRGKSYRVLDRELTTVGERHRFRTAADLRRLIPAGLQPEFTTDELAVAADLPRWWAQKIAYCLRKTGAITAVGKRNRAWLYAQPHRRAA